MVKVLLISYGLRVRCYTGFILRGEIKTPVEVVGIVEPNEFRRNWAKKDFNIPDDKCFASLDEALKVEKFADCAINGTMDQLHYETTLPLLEKGYHVLLEKPVTSDETELLKLKEAADKNNVHLMICHLLRYTPFYGGIKKLIVDGKLGEIMSIMASENVAIMHSSSAFIRGKWRKQSECGSTLLMAKCCHDLDYLCWLNNATKPKYVSSFGGRDFIIPEKAPEGAGMRCLLDCKCEDKCHWSAYKDYINNSDWCYYAFENVDRPLEEITQEERIQMLKTDNYHGVCAYKTDSDLVDHQIVSIKFENGSVATLAMTTGAFRPGRDIHILGTKGEIQGYLESSKFVFREYDEVGGYYKETEYDFNNETGINYGHMGGDGRLVEDFLKIVSGQTPSIAYTAIEDSINGHLCVYAADEAMETNEVVEVESL